MAHPRQDAIPPHPKKLRNIRRGLINSLAYLAMRLNPYTLKGDMIAAAERGPQISFDTLTWLNPIAFHPDVSQPLQRSFAVMILNRTQPANFAVTPVPQSAYELLNNSLPYIQLLLPQRYEQAVSQSLVLRTNIDQAQLAHEERSKRLKDSQSPIEDLVSEAEAANSKNERNELLAEAAELALRNS